MAKNIHEIRDAVHVFVRFDSHERKVLNSRPFQRLRHIHQLGLSHLVYPGATHRRFEHSLGVMELADRVFGVVTQKTVLSDEIRALLPELDNPDELTYWRRVLRMAALCHDIGHLPFSHTGEGLLPPQWSHERLTGEIIRSNEMQQIWEAMTPPLRTEDIVKLAVGPKDAPQCGIDEFSTWEGILAEIIVGDAFGVDRMDYLLRDSYHAGVTYGRFDHYRLIDTLRILTPPPYSLSNGIGGSSGGREARQAAENEESKEPLLGVEEGGLHTAESLLLARYFMFSQVYCHPVRRIYDIHLRDFLSEWLPDGAFSTATEQHLAMTDIEVSAGLREARDNGDHPAHEHATRVLERKHFKVLYSRNPEDVAKNPDAVEAIYEAAREKFGADHVRMDRFPPRVGTHDFPVLARDERIVSSIAQSEVLSTLPTIATDYVFFDREVLQQATDWLEEEREDIISSGQEAET